MRFLEVVVALVIKEIEQRRPKHTFLKRQKINSQIHTYLFMKALRIVLHSVWFHKEPLTNKLYGIVWETKYG